MLPQLHQSSSPPRCSVHIRVIYKRKERVTVSIERWLVPPQNPRSNPTGTQSRTCTTARETPTWFLGISLEGVMDSILSQPLWLEVQTVHGCTPPGLTRVSPINASLPLPAGFWGGMPPGAHEVQSVWATAGTGTAQAQVCCCPSPTPTASILPMQTMQCYIKSVGRLSLLCVSHAEHHSHFLKAGF